MKKMVALLLSTLQEKKNRIYNFLIYSVFTLNITDGFFSYFLISKQRVLEEANPIWEPIIYTHPNLFLFLKILSVSLLCFILLKIGNNIISFIGALICFLVYFSIVSGFLAFSIL